MTEQAKPPEQNDPWLFPCRLDLKVIGETRDGFAADVMAAIRDVLPSGLAGNYAQHSASSSGGKYLSITVAVQFATKAEVELVYAALRKVRGLRLVL